MTSFVEFIASGRIHRHTNTKDPLKYLNNVQSNISFEMEGNDYASLILSVDYEGK